MKENGEQARYQSILKSMGITVFVVVLFYSIRWLASVLTIYPLRIVGVSDSTIQERPWIYGYSYKFLQLTLGLLAVLLLSRGNLRAWGFNFRNKRLSLLGLVNWFFPLFVAARLLYSVWVFAYFGRRPTFDYALDTVNVIGELSFAGVFSPLVEEIICRSMMQTALGKAIGQQIHIRGVKIPVAGVIIALVFSLAHFQSYTFPFGISRISFFSVATPFLLGVYCSVMYLQTGSLLNPVLAHGILNTAIRVVSLVLPRS